MKVNLITTFHKDRDESRMRELIFCLSRNLNAEFTRIYLICDNQSDQHYLWNEVEPKLNVKQGEIYALVINEGRRATFDDLFFLANNFSTGSDTISVIANSDIYFEEINTIKEFIQNIEDNEKVCLALSRWDITPSGEKIHFDRADSQDVWIFTGKIQVNLTLNFTMGVAGCDNRIAHEIEQSGYRVHNPSKQIKSYHYHITGIRNYIDENGIPKERVPPPYLLVQPY